MRNAVPLLIMEAVVRTLGFLGSCAGRCPGCWGLCRPCEICRLPRKDWWKHFRREVRQDIDASRLPPPSDDEIHALIEADRNAARDRVWELEKILAAIDSAVRGHCEREGRPLHPAAEPLAAAKRVVDEFAFLTAQRDHARRHPAGPPPKGA